MYFSYLRLYHPPPTYSSAFQIRSHTSKSRTTSAASEWQGLKAWRNNAVDENRWWGLKGPENIQYHSSPFTTEENNENIGSLAEWGALVLNTADPVLKASLSHDAYKQWCHHKLPLGVASAPEKPARPVKPHLVLPKEIPSPKNSPMPHNAYILHNLAHIELNAIDLAWDTIVRFSTASKVLGSQFFSDFAHVADDESRHFSWCSQRLAELGFSYGDMSAHNLLWRDCQKTSDSVSARLAVIPIVQEARGLDAGPRLVQKLVGLGDNRTSDIVARIAEEEVAHVAVGVSWFMQVCRNMDRIPDETFRELLEELDVELKGPFNYSARTEAGIPRDWYDASNMDGPRWGKHLDLRKDKGITVLPVASPEDYCNPHHSPIDESNRTTNSNLHDVYGRLACIVAMETENSKL